MIDAIVTALAVVLAWVTRACNFLGAVRDALTRAQEYIGGIMSVSETVAAAAKVSPSS